MKTVQISGAKQFQIKEVDMPKGGKEDVEIDVKYAGICGSDIHYWEIGNPEGMVMGHEFCGVVTKTGSRKDLKVGDRVTALPISPCNECPACKSGNPQYCRQTWTYGVGLSLTNPGAYAPHIFVRPDMVIKVPDNVTDKEATLAEPMAVALHAVHLSNITVGSKVLVVGGGMIGLASALFAKMQGASYVAISETNAARGENAVKLKVADEYLNALDEKFVENAVAISGGGFDCVIECCGNSAAVNSAVMVTRPGGTVVLVGVSLTPINFVSTVAVMAELTVKGAIAYTKQEFEECLELMSKKLLDVNKFITKVVSQEEVQASFEELTSGKSKSIKILVDPNL